MRATFRPSLFLLTGLAWLILASLLGLVLFLGMTLGRPVPPVLRSLHVHGALIGGAIQIIVGLLLAGRDASTDQPRLFTALNLGVIVLLVGQAHNHFPVMAIAGAVLIGSFFPLIGDLVRQFRHSEIEPPWSYWFYGIALASLTLGLLAGEAAPLRLIPYTMTGQARLAHIHFLVQGFMILMIVGAMHAQFPSFLNGRLHSITLARLTYALLPLGIVVLITGFMLSQLWVEIPGGVIMLLGTALYGYNIVRTWLDAGRPRKAASDLCLIATFFFTIAVVCGILVAANALQDPPFAPFGALHLAAYTHLAFIGFVLFSLIGALTDLLPNLLAAERTKSNKKRIPYEAELIAVIERRARIQLWTLSLGTMGMFVAAALVWQYPLNSTPVKLAAWASSLALFTGLALLSVNAVKLVFTEPEE